MLSARFPRRQEGVVLIIALIMLIAMTLGGLALMRSVSTTTAIAGNLAFQQAATNSGDRGIEAAVTWLESNNSAGTLYEDSLANGYSASKAAADDPSGNQDWTDLWTAVWVPRGVVTVTQNGSSIDAAGNTVQYAIQRLCNGTGDPLQGANCAVAPSTGALAPGQGHGGGIALITPPGQVYYRITVRVSGPRNTVSFIQSTVAL